MGYKIVYSSLFLVLLSSLLQAAFRGITKENPNSKISFLFLESGKVFSGKEFKVTDLFTCILIYVTVNRKLKPICLLSSLQNTFVLW